MNRWSGILLVLVALLFARPAIAYDAYNSFEAPGDVYNATTGWAADGGFYGPGFKKIISGCRFTSLATGELAVIRIALHTQNSPAQPGFNQVDVRLHEADASGDLGPILAAFTRGGLPDFGLSGPPETITSFDPAVVLTAGKRYWIVVAPGDETTKAVWNWSTAATGAANRLAISNNGGASYFYLDSQPVGAMRIELIPEPATVSLLAVGIVVASVRQRRRR